MASSQSSKKQLLLLISDIIGNNQQLYRGRAKELIVTSGGENIAPVPIEENIKKELLDVRNIKTKLTTLFRIIILSLLFCKIVSNCIVIGDGYKHLTCLLTLKVNPDPITQQPTQFLDDGAKDWINKVLGTDGGVETIKDFGSGTPADKLTEGIKEGIGKIGRASGWGRGFG